VNELSVNTSQNVMLNYKLASLGDRILAALIDLIILLGFMFIMIFGIALINESLFLDDSFNSFFIIIMLLVFLPFAFYDLLCEQFMNGQSFGKRAMKIKVVKEDGSQPTFGNYFVRWILRIVDGQIFSWIVGIIVIAVTDKSQRVGDIAAKTVVIKIQPMVKLEDTIFFDVDESVVVKYDKALNLNDREVELIRSVLNRPFTEEKPKILAEMSNKIRTVIETEKDELNDTQFLNKVLQDYNYLSIRA